MHAAVFDFAIIINTQNNTLAGPADRALSRVLERTRAHHTSSPARVYCMYISTDYIITTTSRVAR